MAGKKWPHIFVALHFPAHKNVASPPPRLVHFTATYRSATVAAALAAAAGAHCGADAEFFLEKDFSEAKCAEATRNLRINGDGLKLLPPYSCCPLLTPPANRLPPMPAGWPPSKIALIFLHSPGKDKLRLQFSLAWLPPGSFWRRGVCAARVRRRVGGGGRLQLSRV